MPLVEVKILSLIESAFMKKKIDFSFDYNDDELQSVVEYISTNVPDLTIPYSYYIEENEIIVKPRN